MAYRVHILETDEAFHVEEGESVLQAAERSAVKLPHECTFGSTSAAIRDNARESPTWSATS